MDILIGIFDAHAKVLSLTFPQVIDFCENRNGRYETSRHFHNIVIVRSRCWIQYSSRTDFYLSEIRGRLSILLESRNKICTLTLMLISGDATGIAVNTMGNISRKTLPGFGSFMFDI